MLENLSAFLDENEDHLLDIFQTEKTQHLRFLESQLKMYFPELEDEDQQKSVRNLVSDTLDITATPSEVQDEFFDLKNDFAAKDLYEDKSLNIFLVLDASVISRNQ